MKFIRIKAVARKEIIHIIRDPFSLFMAIALPIFMILLYSYCLSLDVDHLSTAVLDFDGNEMSRKYMDHFRGTKYFDLNYRVNNYKELTDLMDRGLCNVAIVFPPDFTRKLGHSEPVSLQVVIEGSDTNTANAAQGYVTVITQMFNLELMSDLPVKQRPLSIDNRVRVLFNEELESKNYIVPGLIAVIITVLASLLTSLTVSREWDRGTMEQLISTPISPRELVTGKLIPYIIIGLIDVLLAAATGVFVFDVPFKGSFPELVAISIIFVIGVMSWGLLLSVNASNQLLASQMALVSSFLPSFLLSGFIFPIYAMPSVIQYGTLVIPARYMVTILKGIFLKGSGMQLLWVEILFLSIYAFVIYNNACSRFKKKLV